MEVLVNHKIHSKDLEIMLSSLSVNIQIRRFDCICCYLLHFRICISIKAIFSSTSFLDVSLKFWVAKFISFLVFSVLWKVFLNSIVCKMNSGWATSKVVFKACSSQVTLLIPIASDYTIQAADHHIMSYIEFPSVVKKRSVKICLNDVGFMVSIWVLLFSFYYCFDFF